MAIVITNDKRLARREVIIKNTHRGLVYEDGVLVRVLEAGRYLLPARFLQDVPFLRRARVEIVLVDVRERELTIKGQEILTSDKVAIRVSIVVQFRVTDPAAALEQVAEFEDRLYSDVQLAARRSLASMTLEDILTNRTRLSEDILADVLGAAVGYGVQIQRADVKDLIFPGNLQEIMNRVLATERLSERNWSRRAPRRKPSASMRRPRPRLGALRRPPRASVSGSPPRLMRRPNASAPPPRLRRSANASRWRTSTPTAQHCCGCASWRRYATWPGWQTRASTSVSTSTPASIATAPSRTATNPAGGGQPLRLPKTVRLPYAFNPVTRP
jgi:hypothetical protein